MTNVERVELLAQALESGMYSQTRDHLKDDGGHCCLGVACEVYARETGDGEWIADTDAGFPTGRYIFVVDSRYASWSELPEPVKDWYGFGWRNPRVDGVYLSDLNDRGVPFVEIAGKIREAAGKNHEFGG